MNIAFENVIRIITDEGADVLMEYSLIENTDSWLLVVIGENNIDPVVVTASATAYPLKRSNSRTAFLAVRHG